MIDWKTSSTVGRIAVTGAKTSGTAAKIAAIGGLMAACVTASKTSSIGGRTGEIARKTVATVERTEEIGEDNLR